MTTTISSSTALHALHKRILALSRAQEPMQSIDDVVTVEDVERMRAEEHYHYALSRRIWWQLAPEERDLIRSIVLAEYPSHGAIDASFEAACFSEVYRCLAEAHLTVFR